MPVILPNGLVGGGTGIMRGILPGGGQGGLGGLPVIPVLRKPPGSGGGGAGTGGAGASCGAGGGADGGYCLKEAGQLGPQGSYGLNGYSPTPAEQSGIHPPCLAYPD